MCCALALFSVSCSWTGRSAPSISVLLPVRDEAAHLAEALASLRRQTFQDFEVLVQDDGSTDGSVAIAEEVARSDPRFRVVSEAHRGLVPALNYSRGSLVFFWHILLRLRQFVELLLPFGGLVGFLPVCVQVDET